MQHFLDTVYIVLFIVCTVLGFGVFATKDFSKGEFLLEYFGNLMSYKNGDGIDDCDQTYIFHFRINGKKYWQVFSHFYCYTNAVM